MNTTTVKFAKLTWMIFWRYAIVSTVITENLHVARALAVAAAAAAVMIFVFKRDIHAFPVFRFFLGLRPVIYPLHKVSTSSRTAQNKSAKAQPSNTGVKPGPRYAYQTPTENYDRPVSSQTAERGFMTGYEPKALENVVIPNGAQSRVFGSPGSGLNNSNFSQSNISRGIAGETQFAQALTAAGCINSVDSFWSVSMPSTATMNPDRNMPTDIDCVLVVGNRILLIDVKNYSGGNGTYYNVDSHTLAMVDNVTGDYVGKWRKMSQNMSMALERFTNNLSGYTVEAHVVFVPTSRGSAYIAPGTAWPGGVYATNLSDFIPYLDDMIANTKMMQVDRNIRNILFGLVDNKN